MKVIRETTGTISLSIEASQHEFAELCDALEAGRKTRAQKDQISELATLVREAAGLGEAETDPE
jgi:hypothetical protein